jgi:hypothetical protein
LEERVAAIVDGDVRDGADQLRCDEVGDVEQVEQTVVEGQAALAKKVASLAVDLLVEAEDWGTFCPDEGCVDAVDLASVLDLLVVALQDMLRGVGVEAVVVDDVAKLAGQIEDWEDAADLEVLVACDADPLAVEVDEVVGRAARALEGML